MEKITHKKIYLFFILAIGIFLGTQVLAEDIYVCRDPDHPCDNPTFIDHDNGDLACPVDTVNCDDLADCGTSMIGYADAEDACGYWIWQDPSMLNTVYMQGIFQSTNILAGADVDAINSINVVATVPANTALQIQFSKDKYNYYDSAGTKWGWDSCSNGTTNVNLSALNWSGLTGGSLYYKLKFTTTDQDITPVVSEVQLNYDGTVVPVPAPTVTYYRQGDLVSNNLLTGAEVTAINSFQVDAYIPSGTTVGVKYSQDGIHYYNSLGVKEGFDYCNDGTTNIDLSALNWSEGRFYYRIEMKSVIQDNLMTPRVYAVNVDYDGTAVPPETGFDNYLLGTMVSTNLLEGSETIMTGGDKFGYNISFLPGTTAVQAQFSKDGVAWYNSSGTINAWDTLEIGDHTSVETAVDLTPLNWRNSPTFYYKLKLSSTYYNSLSPIVTDAGYVFDRLVPQLGTVELNFNKPSNDMAYDESASKNDAFLISGTTGDNTAVGMMWDQNGKTEGAMEFDGTDDRLKIYNFNFPANDKMSVFQYVNFQTLATNKSIVSQWGNSNNNFLIKTDDTNPNELKVCIASSLTDDCTNYAYTIDANLTTNNWYNIQIMYDGSQSNNEGKLKMYINGKQKILSYFGSIPATMTAPLSTVEIGGDNDLSTYFQGKIDELRIYNSVLTVNEKKIVDNGDAVLRMGFDNQRNNNGNQVSGAAKEHCIPGDTAKCDLPVGEWDMDEGSGTTIYDSSGNVYNGSMVNSPAWVPGKFGSALRFGTNNYVRMPNIYNIGVGFAGTISFWAKGSGPAISNYRASTSVGDGSVYIESDGKMRYTADTRPTLPYSYSLVGTIPADINKWNFYSLVLSVPAASGVLSGTLYVNGVGQPLSNSAYVVSGAVIYKDIEIGVHRNYTYGTSYFNGQIDEVKIYNYARTPAQIAWDYNRNKPYAHWKMDEGQDVTAHNESSNENHATLTNMDAATDWVDGKNKKALDFDGTDDIVTASAFQFPSTNQFTMSQYINLKTLDTGKPIIGEWGSSQNNVLIKLDDIENDELKICIASSLTDNCTIYGVTTDLNLTTNNWINAQVIYDGTQATNDAKLKLYIDGVEKTLGYVGTIPTTIRSTSTAGITMGGNSSIFTSLLLDDVKIYGFPLSSEQVKQDYVGGSVIFE
ncbi:MAG: LamG-like jellyroll fold domain-containing protein [Candidatus Moraniibacteriota bacterium]